MSARRSRRAVFVALASGLGLMLGSAGKTQPLLIWNVTASAPLGVYAVTPIAAVEIRRGMQVLAKPPETLAPLFAQRGYLPLGVALLKPVAAVAGQTVCERAGIVSIDGRPVARAFSVDGRGRPLPRLQGCKLLGKGAVFLLNPSVPASLDGRYLGPTPVSAIIGRAVPLWTRKAS